MTKVGEDLQLDEGRIAMWNPRVLATLVFFLLALASIALACSSMRNILSDAWWRRRGPKKKE